IRFMIRPVDFEQMQPAVDGLDESDRAGRGVHHADAATDQPAGFVGDPVVDVAGPEHRPVLWRPRAIPKPVLNAALDVAEFSLAVDSILVFTGAHSKCLLAIVNARVCIPENARHFEFFSALSRTN